MLILNNIILFNMPWHLSVCVSPRKLFLALSSSSACLVHTRLLNCTLQANKTPKGLWFFPMFLYKTMQKQNGRDSNF